MPITFYVEIQDPNKDQAYATALSSFVNFYNCLEGNKNNIVDLKE